VAIGTAHIAFADFVGQLLDSGPVMYQLTHMDFFIAPMVKFQRKRVCLSTIYAGMSR
jgi:hypothetical protein